MPPEYDIIKLNGEIRGLFFERSLHVVMSQTGRLRTIWLLACCVAAFRLAADPVSLETARRVAVARLPAFYAGSWRLADEYALENLSGETVAYTFVFSKSAQTSVAASGLRTLAPTSFVAKARANLKRAGKNVTGNSPELYGADTYASIVISADDTEPPVLRCFTGLPSEVVKETDALELISKQSGSGAWRVRRRLMLGMFDEAFLIENTAETSVVQVVDMRTGSVVTKAAALSRASVKKAAAVKDADRVRLCQAAWREAEAKSRSAASASGKQAANSVRKKGSTVPPSPMPLRQDKP